ncbi:perilipin-3 [Callorhinchus milii]|uniref:Perilipin n=1 Tax=Callorhinchus milii TaxID=7868 RepID=A0A4W3GEC4_CALMI|nr:perilipin-3 [Callorhinchus milii]|eukprot:gi/632966273/ref/XP_007899323.1/ PREDICTED: perilipin-3-like [Callorhinchus milii]
MASTENVSKAEQQEPETQQSVVERVTNLPLVSSACDTVSAVYDNTKESHPYVKTVCDVAEQGVKTLSTVAASGAKPILDKLEPQISAVNEYACRGLDTLEEKLPILNQPEDQVFVDAKELVTSKVTDAKDAVTGVVDVAKDAVQESLKRTTAAVAEGVHVVLDSKVGQIVASGVDATLTKSEELIDHYLPMTQEELAELATSVEGSEETPGQERSYYVRLGSLSLKVRNRAYQHSVAKIQLVRNSGQETLSQLHHLFDLIEMSKKGTELTRDKLQEVQEGQNTKQPEDQTEVLDEPKHPESNTLAIMRNLTEQLQKTCLSLASNISGLPQNTVDQVKEMGKAAEEISTFISSAGSFQDLSGKLLAQSKEQMKKIRESLDSVMDYMHHNTHLNWLVGPFAPQPIEQTEPQELMGID